MLRGDLNGGRDSFLTLNRGGLDKGHKGGMWVKGEDLQRGIG